MSSHNSSRHSDTSYKAYKTKEKKYGVIKDVPKIESNDNNNKVLKKASKICIWY